jgi:hypothetical protein
MVSKFDPILRIAAAVRADQYRQCAALGCFCIGFATEEEKGGINTFCDGSTETPTRHPQRELHNFP